MHRDPFNQATARRLVQRKANIDQAVVGNASTVVGVVQGEDDWIDEVADVIELPIIEPSTM